MFLSNSVKSATGDLASGGPAGTSTGTGTSVKPTPPDSLPSPTAAATAATGATADSSATTGASERSGDENNAATAGASCASAVPPEESAKFDTSSKPDQAPQDELVLKLKVIPCSIQTVNFFSLMLYSIFV